MENFITTEGKLRYLYGITTGNTKMPKYILKGEIGKSAQEGDLRLYSPQLLYKGYIKANLLFIRLLVSEQKYEEATKLAKMFGNKFKINSSYDISTAASYILSNMYDYMFTRKGETLSVELLRSFQIDLASVLIDVRYSIYDKADEKRINNFIFKETKENPLLTKKAFSDYSGQSLFLDYIERYIISEIYDDKKIVDCKFTDIDFSMETTVFGISIDDIISTFNELVDELKDLVVPYYPTITHLYASINNYYIKNGVKRRYILDNYTERGNLK